MVLILIHLIGIFSIFFIFNNTTPLLLAIKNNNFDLVQELVEKGSILNFIDNYFFIFIFCQLIICPKFIIQFPKIIIKFVNFY